MQTHLSRPGRSGRTSKFNLHLENSFADSVQNCACPVGNVEQSSDHGPLSDNRRSLIKDYVEAALSVHFHLLAIAERRSDPNESTLGNYCVVLECAVTPDSFLNVSGIGEGWESKIKRLQRSADKVDHAVLVSIRKFIKMPKRTTFVLPCRERLERFNERCSLLSNSLQHREAASIKFGGIVENGELKSIDGWGKPVIDKQEHLVNRVIECRTEIVNDLADDNSPHWRARGIYFHADGEICDADTIPEFCAELDRRHVRVSVHEGSDFVLERIELLAGALEFELNPVQIR